jgi:flavin reductase (DIM6/NTAB) family NADH-FMN oxidoreductase RutF
VKTPLRRALGLFPTGVCVVTTHRGGPGERRHDAVTINSFVSLSLDPPLVGVCLRADSRFLADATVAGVLSISVLGGDMEPVARSFARPSTERSTVDEVVPCIPGSRTECLVLRDAVAWLECRVAESVVVGDHTMLVAEVLDVGWRDSALPLVFHGGQFGPLAFS